MYLVASVIVKAVFRIRRRRSVRGSRRRSRRKKTRASSFVATIAAAAVTKGAPWPKVKIVHGIVPDPVVHVKRVWRYQQHKIVALATGNHLPLLNHPFIKIVKFHIVIIIHAVPIASVVAKRDHICSRGHVYIHQRVVALKPRAVVVNGKLSFQVCL